jgi:hypothetical protein
MICKNCGKESETWFCSYSCLERIKAIRNKSYERTKTKNKKLIRLWKVRTYMKNKDKIIEREREYSKDNPEVKKEIAKRYREKNKEKNRIRLFHKNLQKIKCERCETNKNLQIHHKKYVEDISETIVLCRECHNKEHFDAERILMGLEEK